MTFLVVKGPLTPFIKEEDWKPVMSFTSREKARAFIDEKINSGILGVAWDIKEIKDRDDAE